MAKRLSVFLAAGAAPALVAAQRERLPGEELPKGLERWLGVDECGAHQHWIDFYHTFSNAITLYKQDKILSPELQSKVQPLAMNMGGSIMGGFAGG